MRMRHGRAHATRMRGQVVRKITFRGPMIVGRQILAGWPAVESAIRPREIALRNLSILQSD